MLLWGWIGGFEGKGLKLEEQHTGKGRTFASSCRCVVIHRQD